MFGKNASPYLMSHGTDFEGVEVLISACDHYAEAVETITDAGFCLSSAQKDYLRHGASRVAALAAIADQGVACISAADRYRINELADEIDSFR